MAVAPFGPVVAYARGRGLYLNLTNRCPTACVFCLKRLRAWDFEGQDLRLGPRPPAAPAVVAAARELIDPAKPPAEAVFCGYGESTYRLPVMREVAAGLSRVQPGLRWRLNTIGLGDLINGRRIASELREFLDGVSVSLNTADPRQWERLHAPSREFSRGGFAAVLQFARDCVAEGLSTTITAVRIPGVRLDAVRRLARSLGAGFRIRPRLS